MINPKIEWDNGTAYDFFMSLKVVHEPDRWGLRGAWAAGVRSRLNLEHRDFLKAVMPMVFVPSHWVYQLAAPKDAATALKSLAAMPADERIEHVAFVAHYARYTPDMHDLFKEVRDRGSWHDKDLKALRSFEIRHKVKKKVAEVNLNWWAKSAEFGERILSSLQAYYDVFFAEEEPRLKSYLDEALAEAQAKAANLPFFELVESLSGGVQLNDELEKAQNRVVLAPSYWSTPLLIFSKTDDEKDHILFGARPDNASLVPGEVVPETLYQSLKALADPTRLKIMRYLSAEPHTPTELAQKLRLRPPTVIHHLHTLRLAQLVYVAVSKEGRHYAARTEALDSTLSNLKSFIEVE